MEKELPQIIEKVKKEKGVLMYEDEASFQVTGTRTKGWLRRGRNEGREVESKPTRKSVKAYGAVSVSDKPAFHFLFVEKFNAHTFLRFLKRLAKRYSGRKVHLIADNAKYHDAEIVKLWLEKNSELIEVHFLPAYSPDFNAQEGVWRLTRRKSTHNRFFNDEKELHQAIFRRFNRFQGNPASLRNMIAPYYKMMA